MSSVLLNQSMLLSLVWQESVPTRVVWITMLLLADEGGVVDASLPGLATLARVRIEDVQSAIETLCSPNLRDENADYEGRVIEPVAGGGWRLLRYVKDRERTRDEVHRRSAADRQRRCRRRKEIAKRTTLKNLSRPATVDGNHG